MYKYILTPSACSTRTVPAILDVLSQVGVGYTLWTGKDVYSSHHKGMSMGYTYTVYRLNVTAPSTALMPPPRRTTQTGI